MLHMFTFHRQLDHYQHIGRPNPIIINDLMSYFHPDLMSRTLESTAIARVPAPATVFRGLPAAEPDRRRLLHRLAKRPDLGLHQQPRRESRGRAAVSPPLHRRHLDPVETGEVNGHIRSLATTVQGVPSPGEPGLGCLRFGLLRHPALAEGSYSNSPTARGTSKFQVDPTQVREEMGHLVFQVKNEPD